MANKVVKCGNLSISNNNPFTLIAGPCQLESEQHAIEVAMELKKITDDLGIGLVYKTSFDKANRTSLKAKRGVGLEKSLTIFDKIRKKISVPFGSYDVIRVSHQSKNSNRINTFWLAPDLDFIPVKLEQTEDNKVNFEATLVQLIQ